MILENDYRDYYRRRYLDDLAQSKAPLFLDSTGPGDFLFRDASFRHEAIFPELGRYVRAHYTLIAEYEGARLYLRNDRVNPPLVSTP
jgi:hypothetical protein